MQTQASDDMEEDYMNETALVSFMGSEGWTVHKSNTAIAVDQLCSVDNPAQIPSPFARSLAKGTVSLRLRFPQASQATRHLYNECRNLQDPPSQDTSAEGGNPMYGFYGTSQHGVSPGQDNQECRLEQTQGQTRFDIALQVAPVMQFRVRVDRPSQV